MKTTAPPPTRSRCPRCGRKTRLHREGIMQWRVCPATKTCGWTVFTHGDDPRDQEGTRHVH